jgi:hypothetical protein
MVEGRPFVIYRDHKPLTYAFNDAEINAHHDNSVAWSLLANSLLISGMYQGKTML